MKNDSIDALALMESLRKLVRYDVGCADEGDGDMYEYAEPLVGGCWVRWEDLEKLILMAESKGGDSEKKT